MSQNPSTFVEGLLTVQLENARPQNDSAALTFALPPRKVVNLSGLSASDNPTAINADGSVGRLEMVAGGDQGLIVPPPPAALWTNHVNWGAGTSLVDQGATVYLSDFTTGGGQVIFGAQYPTLLPGATYTITAAFRVNIVPDNAHNSSAGIWISDGTKYITFQYTYAASAMDGQVVKFSAAGTAAGNLYSANWNMGTNARFWFKIVNDGVHRSYTTSSDGIHFLPLTALYQEAFNNFLAGETKAGIMVSPIGSIGAGITLESWVQTTP